jgi:hypothetical protein
MIKTVYMLQVEWAQDYETGMRIELFNNEDDAKKAFLREVQDAKCDYDYDNYIREETPTHFEVYEDGYWAKTHCTVELILKEVK